MPVNNRQKKTRMVAFCAMLSALETVLLACGMLTDMLDLTVAALASLLTVLAVMELGGVYPWFIYVVSGTLSLVLSLTNTGAWTYVLFFGYYPMVKSFCERKLNRLFAWICKVLIFNAAFTGYVFALPLLITGEIETRALYLILMYCGGNALLFIFDLALTKLVTAYELSFRERLKLYRFLR